MTVEIEVKVVQVTQKKASDKAFKKALSFIQKTLCFIGYRVEIISAVCYD